MRMHTCQLIRILTASALIVATAGCVGTQRTPTSEGGHGDWPQCWRFQKVVADTFPMVDAPAPYRLFSDGRASFWMDSIGRRADPNDLAPVRWHDVDGARRIEAQAMGFWGSFVTITEPTAPQSAGEASGYSDFGYPEYRFDIRAFRFPCAEASWYPPRS